MKKLLFTVLALTFFGAQSTTAQSSIDEFGIFDHLAASVSLGTTGLGIELAAPVTEYLDVRAGFSYMSVSDFKVDVDYTSHGNDRETEVEASLNLNMAKLLFDVYPFRGKNFHATIGAYMGTDKILKAHNIIPLDVDPGEGLKIGDYIIGPDSKGIAYANLRVNKFRPYLGIGVGRSVPRKRFSVSGDFGLMFWGKPKAYGLDIDGTTYKQVTAKDAGDNDGGDVINNLSKISVWPVLTIRFNGRFF